MTRTLQAAADTGYLLCFGAVARGTRLLGQAFDAGVGASPTVTHELARIANHSKKSGDLKFSAASFVGKNSGVLLAITLEPQDDVRRRTILADLTKGSGPSVGGASLGPATESSATKEIAGGEKSDPAPVELKALEGQDAGEAESIAVCERLGLPLLINDNAGASYAKGLGLTVEPAAVSLIRLRGDTFSPRQLWGIAREMQEKVGDIGAVVTGQLFFTQALPVGTMALQTRGK